MKTAMMKKKPQTSVREYDAKIDTEKRITLGGLRFEYYHVVEFPNGKIELSPKEAGEPYEISEEALLMLDHSVENFKKGTVSEPLDFSELDFIEDIEVDDDSETYGMEGREREDIIKV